MRLIRCSVLLLYLLLQITAVAQNQQNGGVIDKAIDLPRKLLSRFSNKVDRKMDQLDRQLTRQTEKYLHKLARQEKKLQRKLYKTDSIAAKNLGDIGARYAAFSEKIQYNTLTETKQLSGEYLPFADSLKGSLSFLTQNKQLLASSKALSGKLQNSLGSLKQLEGKLQTAEEVKRFIRQRKDLIRQTLSRYKDFPRSLTKSFQNYSKQSYYLSQQVQEYRDILNNPSKWEQKALLLLNKLPAFQNFLQQNSQLAGLFAPLGSNGAAQSVAGLQTRVQTQALIQNQLASAGPNAQAMLQSQLTAAQAQLNSLKDKITRLGNGSGDIDMPDFKPKARQKTKAFWKRLEYGTNLQTTKANNFFPIKTELAATVAYKIDTKNSFGIGVGFMAGWGKNIRHIKVTYEGLNFRSFVDVRIKSSFYASGGFEYYQSKPFAAWQQLYKLDTWHSAGLLGISKIVSLKTKLLKKTKATLSWDFLSYRQVPRSQPVKFRVGYNF